MTERISHEDALGAVASLYEARNYSTAAVKASDTLRAYVDQQQALEADTVSRAEHERAVLTRDRDLASLRKDIKALLKHVATERARAEEAERLERVARGVLKRQADELAAANARAGRLEEAGREILSAIDWEATSNDGGDCADYRNRAMLRLYKRVETILSPAPQASTEQAPVPGCATPGCIYKGGHLGKCFEPGDVVPASTEQASPSPAAKRPVVERYTVGQVIDDELEARGGMTPALAEGLGATFGVNPQLFLNLALAVELDAVDRCPGCGSGPEDPCGGDHEAEPAQPAPGGTERRVNGHVFHGEDEYDFCDLCGVTWGGRFVHRCPALVAVAVDRAVNPTPVEPQGRPEQAGDRPPGSRSVPVYLSEDGVSLAIPGGAFTTIRACRHCGALITGGPTACVYCVRLADRLEGK